jgi:hypothetical protein
LDRLIGRLREAGAHELVGGLETLLRARDRRGRAVRLGDEVTIEGQEWRTSWVVSQLGVHTARVVSVVGVREVPYKQLERVRV